MDRAVFDYSLAAIDAEIDPFIAALVEVEGRAEAIGWNASPDEVWQWWEVRWWLRDYDKAADPEPFFTWRDIIASQRSSGPDVLLEELFGWYRGWRENFADCVAWLQRAGQLIPRLGADAQTEGYLAAALRFWDAMWWWIGWLGRWIHHRARTEAP